MSSKKDIRSCNEDQLKEILISNSFRPFRAKQILHWIWNKSVHSFDEMSKYWNQVKWVDTSEIQKHVHEAGLLKLNCDKALTELGWESVLYFNETVKMTVEWYKHYYEKKPLSMYDYSYKQIKNYMDLANQRNNTGSLDND